VGAIQAAHIPILTGLTPLFNRRMLLKELQPFLFTFWETVLTGVYGSSVNCRFGNICLIRHNKEFNKPDFFKKPGLLS